MRKIIGEVRVLVGDVKIINDKDKERTVGIGSKIYDNDRLIKAKAGYITIEVYSDSSFINGGPHTHTKIPEVPTN